MTSRAEGLSEIERLRLRVSQLERDNAVLRQESQEAAKPCTANGSANDPGRRGGGHGICDRALALAESLPLPIAYVDCDGCCRFANDACAALYRMRREDIFGAHLADLVGRKTYAHIEPAIQSALAGNPITLEQAHGAADRGGEPIKAHYLPNRLDDGSVHGLFAVFTDDTETRRAQDALLTTRARLQAFMDNMPCEMGIKDRAGRYVMINRYAEQLFGRTSEEVRGLTPKDLFPRDVADQLVAQDRKVLRSAVVLTEEVKSEIDGNEQTFLATKFPILNDWGDVAALGSVAIDVSRQKRQEEELRKTGQLYRESERLAELGHWEWDEVVDRCTYCSEELAHLHGYTVDEYLSRFLRANDYLEVVHPQDRDRYRRAAARIGETGSGIKLEYRVVRPDGSCIDVCKVAKPVFDDDGALVRCVGYVQNITGQKRIERALRESERRFKDFADASSHWLWETDSELRFTFVSEGIAKTGGGSASDLVGRTMSEVFCDLRPGSVASNARSDLVLRRERFEDVIVEWATEDAKAIILNLSATPVFDDQNNFVGYRGVARDITEQRRTIENLGQSEALLRQAAEMADLGHWVWDEVADRCIYCSDELARLNGMTVEMFLERLGSMEGLLEVIHPEDRQRYKSVIADAKRKKSTYEVEFRYRSNEGEYRHMRESGEPVFDIDGNHIRTIGIVQDISKSKRAEEELRKSQVDLAEAQRMAKIGHWNRSIETNELVSCSAEYARIHGVPMSDIKRRLSKQVGGVVHPDDRERVRSLFEDVAVHGRDYEIGYRIVRPGGEVRYVHEIGEVVHDEAGHTIAHAGTAQDVTEQKLTEEALRRSEEKYRALIEGSIQGILVHKNWKPFFANQACAVMFGYRKVEEFIAIDSLERHIAPRERARLKKYRDARTNSGRAPSRHTAEYLRSDGTSLFLETVNRVVDWEGEPAIQSTFLDVTERRKAENSLREAARELEHRVEERTAELSATNIALQREIEQHRSTERALRESEKRIRAITDAFPSQIAYVDRDQIYRFNNAAYKQWFGISGEECVGKHVRDVIGIENYQKVVHHIEEALAGENVLYEYLTSQGRYAEANYIPDFDDKGAVRGFYGLIHDITDAKRTEMALTESRELLRAILDVVPVAISVKDPQLRYIFVNRYLASSWGLDAEAAVGHTLDELVDSALAESVLRYDRQVCESGLPLPQYERKVADADGGERHWLTTKIPIKGEDDALRQIVSVSLDVTDLKAREEELRQVHKMEAVGKLTGGIAHDFNNLLFVIRGNLALLEAEFEGNKRAQKIGESIGAAAELGAELTRSLLAFSRQQPLNPTLIDLRETVQGTVATLLGTLGESVRIKLSCGDELWPVVADRGMLENCILNLALNARDSMPDGGTLCISIGNRDSRTETGHISSLPQGADTVEISVADTGTGMTKEVAERCFEPFFTTKPPGSGTGLGLSMVYGFISQSGGDLEIDSEPGKGTTIRLYLPRAEHTDRVRRVSEATRASAAHGVETILVAEDDEAVRRIAVKLLRDLGYRTREASDAAEALGVLEDEPGINLLFTDVVLPGKVNGPQLAKLVRASRPNVKVLFTTGHSSPGVLRDLSAWGDDKLLFKPYGPEELADFVRVELDRVE